MPSASVQNDSELRPDRHKVTGSPQRAREPAAAPVKMKQLAELWAALLSAQALDSPMEQETAIDRCMAGLTTKMAATLLDDLNSEALKGIAAQRLFDHWASTNPGDAAAWAQSRDDLKTRQFFLNVAAVRWATTDLKEAAAWVRRFPEGDSRTELMAAVGSEAVRSDPLESLRLAGELPAGAAQTGLILRASAEWAGTDRDNAMEWAKQIADHGLRQQVVEQIAVASAEKDPVGAATIALQQMAPGEEQDRAVVSIVQRWVQTDPAAASAWVSEFPEDALGRDAIANLVNLWAGRDLVASGNWLLTLQSGGLRDAGFLAYSQVLRRTDAALAERWALAVPRGH